MTVPPEILRLVEQVTPKQEALLGNADLSSPSANRKTRRRTALAISSNEALSLLINHLCCVKNFVAANPIFTGFDRLFEGNIYGSPKVYFQFVFDFGEC